MEYYVSSAQWIHNKHASLLPHSDDFYDGRMPWNASSLFNINQLYPDREPLYQTVKMIGTFRSD